jgi:serine/threonine-protein kinase HipA
VAASVLVEKKMWQISKGRLDRIVVFIERDGASVPVGELLLEGGERRRISHFRFARSWLGQPQIPILFPAGPLPRRKATASAPHEIPLAFYDASPDGWGKTVLSYAYPMQFFGPAEYLAAAGDYRTGELLFGPSPEEGPQRWIPPGEALADLPAGPETLEEIVAAAAAVEAGEAERHHVKLLLKSGADVGGARPKARIRRGDTEWIAKFPAAGDPFDDPRVEALCLSLAARAGIIVPEHELIQVAGKSVLLVRRFDRDQKRRLGYCSAATLLGQPAVDYGTQAAYADIAIRARAAGIQPCEADLFRRLIFNCAINNTDDHLRNHAFIRDDAGWHISPAFDLVVGRGQRLVLRPSTGRQPTVNIDDALAAAPDFGLTAADASSIRGAVDEAIASISELADRWGVSKKDLHTIREMAPLMRLDAFNGRTALARDANESIPES